MGPCAMRGCAGSSASTRFPGSTLAGPRLTVRARSRRVALRARGRNRPQAWRFELNRFALNEDPRLDLAPLRAEQLRVETFLRRFEFGSARPAHIAQLRCELDSAKPTKGQARPTQTVTARAPSRSIRPNGCRQLPRQGRLIPIRPGSTMTRSLRFS